MNNKRAFTLIEIMIVAAIIAVVAGGIAIYNHVKSMEKAAAHICLENRRMIERAEQLYALDTGQHTAAIQDLVDAGYLKSIPVCPSGGVYAWVSGGDSGVLEYTELVCSVHGTDTTEEAALTSLGSSFDEITAGMIALLENFYEENGRYPRSWGEYVFTDIGLDPDEWSRDYDGLIYTPAGSRIKVEPAEGYSMTMTDAAGNERVLTSDLNWDLWYDMKTETWYYYSVNPRNEIDIGTLVVEKE